MQLHNNDGHVTVIIDVSFSDDVNTIKDFILNEQCPFIQSKDEEGLIKFEWFIDEETKTGTLIEVFKDAISWERLAVVVIGCLLYTSPSPRDHEQSRMPCGG